MTDSLLNPILTALREHHSRLCEMWREEIESIPEEDWASGSIDYLIPARHLVHVLVTNDFYLGEVEPGEYDWNRLFGGDWEGMLPKQLPSREQAVRKLEEIEDRIDSRLAVQSDDDLCKPQTLMPWAGATKMHVMLYWLRHFQHHLGEVHSELRRRGLPRSAWR